MKFEVLASGYGLVEGPNEDAEGGIVFSDVLGGGVYRIDATGAVTTLVPKRRGVGGIALHADGGVVCSGRDIVHVRDGVTRTLFSIPGLPGWNDLCTDAAGHVYAGALRFAVFDPDAEAIPGELWRVGGDGPPTTLVDDILHANGVAASADGGTIYVSDTRRQRIVVFDVERGARRAIDVSALGHPDGLALDEAGAIFVALVGGGIARLRPDGDVDTRFEPPSAFTTSVCFSGRDLYVTTGGHSERPELAGCVLRTTVDVAGAPVFPARV